MKIKKLHLKKYKRFSDLTIDLGESPKRIVALVGPNGCGKSSVFDAMLFLKNAYGRIGGSSSRKDYKYHSLDQAPNYDYQNVSIIFTDGEFAEVNTRKKQEGKENTIFSFRSSFRYNGSLNVTESKAVSELRKNDFGASSAADIDQRIDQNYRRLNIKYNKYLNDNDCRPSEAKAHIIGELNSAIGNCLKLKIDNLGSIEAGKGTFFSKKKIPQMHLNTMCFRLEKKKLLIFFLICTCEKMSIQIPSISSMNPNSILIPQFKENC